MKLYHASFEDLTTGKRHSKANQRTIKPYQKKIESLFDNHRPSNCHSRLTSWFAFKKIEDAAFYIMMEKKWEKIPDKPHIFKVKIANPLYHPMYLVDFLLKIDDEKTQNKIISEYWNPTHDWNFMEYLGEEIWIDREEEFPDDTTGVSLNYYMLDKSLAQKIWGR